MKNIKIGIKLPSNNQLNADMKALVKQMEKQGIINITLDTKAFSKSLGEMSKMLSNLKTQLGKFNILENVETSGVKKAKSEIKSLGIEVENSTRKLSKVEIKVDASGAETRIKSYKESFSKTSQQVVKDGYIMSTKTTENFEKIDKQIERNMASQDKFVKSLEVSIARANKSGNIKLSEELTAISESAKNLNTKNIDIFAGCLDDLKQKAKLASIEFKDSSKTVDTLGNSFGKLTNATVVVSAIHKAMNMLANGFREGLQYVKELDTAFTDISITMDMSRKGFEDMTVKVQDMAKEMGISATAVMDVVKTYANAQADINDVLDKAKPSIILSNISGLGTKEVTKAVQSALNAFKLLEDGQMSAKDATERFGDSIVAVSKNMQYDFGDGVRQIIDGIQTSGNVADTAGVSMESYIATLGALIESTGLSGSELSNGYKMIASRILQIKELTDETGASAEELSKAETALKKHNIAVRDGQGGLRNLDDILKDLSVAWRTMNEEERQNVAESVAGNRNRTTLVALMNSMIKQEQLYSVALNSTGTMMEAQGKYAESLNGKLGTLKATAQEFWSKLVSSKLAKGFIDSLILMGETLNKFADGLGAGTVAITLLTTALMIFKAKALAGAIAGIVTFGVKIGVISATSAIATTSVTALSASIASLGGILALIILPIASIVALGVALNKSTEELKQFNDEYYNMAKNNPMNNIEADIANYKKLENQLSRTSENTGEYQRLQSELSSQLDDLIAKYPDLIKYTEDLAGARTLDTEATAEAIEKQNELMRIEARKNLDKNNLKTKEDIDRIIKLYTEAEEKVSFYNQAVEKGNGDVKVNDGGLKSIYKALEQNEQMLDQYGSKLRSAMEALKVLGVDAGDLALSIDDIGKALGLSAREIDVLKNSMNSATTENENFANSLEMIGNVRFDKNIESQKEALDEFTKMVEAIDDIDPTIDLSGLDLSMVSNEFINITTEVTNAQTAIEKFAGIFDVLGEGVEVLEELKLGFEENGYITDDLAKKIMATGNADLIALLDDESLTYDNIIALLNEYSTKQEEAKQKAIESANEKVKANKELEESYISEEQRIAKIKELQDQLSESRMNENGVITDSSNNTVKQLSNVIVQADATRSAIVELNGEPIMVNYDDSGNPTGKMSTVKQIADDTYASVQLLNGEPVMVVMDSESTEATAYDLGMLYEQANNTYSSLVKVGDKSFVVNFDENGQTLSMNEVKESAEGLNGQIEEIDGKYFTVKFDGETLNKELTEVQKNIDGTYSKIEEKDGKAIEIVMNGYGEVIGQIDDVNSKIDDYEGRVDALNSKPMMIIAEVDGVNETITDLEIIGETANGTYEAIGMLNDRPVKVTFDNKGQIVGDIQEVTKTVNESKASVDKYNKTSIKTNSEGGSQARRDLQRTNESIEYTRKISNDPIIITTIHREVNQRSTSSSSGGSSATPFSVVPAMESRAMPMALSDEGVSDSPIGVSRSAVTRASSSSVSTSGDKDVPNLNLEIDRYIKLNDVLDDYLNRLSFIRERLKDNTLSYKSRNAYLKEEIDLLWKQREAINALIIEKRKEANESKKYLEQYNFKFDSAGNILNANEMLEIYQRGANNRTGQDKEVHVEWVKKLQEEVEKYVKLTNGDLASLESQWADTVSNINNANLDMLTNLREKIVDSLREERRQDKENKIKDLDNRIAELKKEMADLDDEQGDRREQKAKLEAELAKWSKDDSAIGKKKQQELQEKIKELEKQIKKDEIQNEIDKIEDEKQAIEDDYQQKLSDKELYLEADRLLAEKNVDAIKELLQSQEESFKGLGNLLGSAFTDDFMSEIKNALDALEYLQTGKKPSGMTNSTVGNGSIKSSRVTSMATGGYTGDWSSNDGKLAVLHKKERVLSAEQTRNFDKLIEMLPKFVNNPAFQINGLIKSLFGGFAGVNNGDSGYVVNNEWNITNNTEMDVKKTEKSITEVMKAELRKYGKLK